MSILMLGCKRLTKAIIDFLFDTQLKIALY